jgi:hypothetical protein
LRTLPNWRCRYVPIRRLLLQGNCAGPYLTKDSPPLRHTYGGPRCLSTLLLAREKRAYDGRLFPHRSSFISNNYVSEVLLRAVTNLVIQSSSQAGHPRSDLLPHLEELLDPSIKVYFTPPEAWWDAFEHLSPIPSGRSFRLDFSPSWVSLDPSHSWPVPPPLTPACELHARVFWRYQLSMYFLIAAFIAKLR